MSALSAQSASPKKVDQTPISRSNLHAYQQFFSHPDERLSTLFSPKFLELISPQIVLKLRAQFRTLLGDFKEIKGTSQPFKLIFSKGYAPSRIALDDRGAISMLWFGAPIPEELSIESIKEQLSKIPDELSALVVDDQGNVIFAHNPDLNMAVGSAFKLYILRALVEKVKADGAGYMSSVIPIKEGYKSLPSGTLHTWPIGTPMSIASLAHLMISVSDNTATDHLLHAIGRKNVERYAPKSMIPFLSTREMFLLKIGASTEEKQSRYINGDLKARRKVLSTLKRDTLKGVKPLVTPTLIKELEWITSTRDLCQQILTLGPHPSLTINPGLIQPSTEWESVAFKGGSEPGVLNYTHLVQAKGKARRYCVSTTSNNTKVSVDQSGLTTLTSRLLEWARRQP